METNEAVQVANMAPDQTGPTRGRSILTGTPLCRGGLPPCSPRLSEEATAPDNPVSHPAHYTSHPSGVECIVIAEHMGFCVGNAMKYLWRLGLKGNPIEDLKKARWYIEREIQRLEAANARARD